MTPEDTARAPSRPSPLSPRQSLLWVDSLLNPQVPINNVLTRLEIFGEVDPQRFSKAFSSVVRMSEALRTKVNAEGTQASVDPEMPSQLMIQAEIGDPQMLTSAVLDLCRTSFRPGAPLHRATLIRRADAHWTFYLNQHHSITDSLSCLSLHRRLSELYAAPQTALPPLNVRSPRVVEQSTEDFWAQRFQARPPPLRFYGVQPEHAQVQTLRVTRQLSQDLSGKLRGLRSVCPPSLLFATAVLAYLLRVTNTEDLVLGVPLLNRTAEERESLGLYMEICPNRIAGTEDDTFQALLQKVLQEAASVKPHRHALVPARTAGYDVLLNFHPPSLSRFHEWSAQYELTTPLNVLGALAPDEKAVRKAGASESIAVQVHQYEEDGRFELSLDLSTQVFSTPQMRERALAHLESILRQLCENRDLKIGELDLLNDEERKQLSPHPQTVDLPPIIQQIEEIALRQPDEDAVHYQGETLSYGELLRRAKRLAAHLQKLGARPGRLVAVCVERSIDMLIALLGTMRSGAAYVPLDPRHPTTRNQLVLEDARPIALLGSGQSARSLSEASGCKLVELSDSWWESMDAVQPVPAPSPELAYVIFTSGSTGRPKGVRVGHRSLSAFMAAMKKAPGMTAEDRLLAVTTVSFDIAALELYLPLLSGGQLRIVPYETAINGAALGALLDSEDYSIFQATPATFRMLIAAGWTPNPPQLKLLCGGEALPEDLAQALLMRSKALWNMYGPTETTIWSTTQRVSSGLTNIGRPISGTQVYVVNKQLQRTPLGVPGELLIAGEGVAQGYHNRPDLTAARFTDCPFDQSRAYRTGDLARFDQQGALEYLGRVDHQVKIRGFRVELGEIESLLNAHPSIQESVLTSRPDASGERSLAAYFILERGISEVEVSELRMYLQAHLPSYMVPSSFTSLAEFPMTGNAKVDRKALPEPQVAQRPSLFTPADSDFQESLLSAWRKVLKRHDVGVEDDFFEVGGHSIMALQLVQEIERSTGISVPLGTVFEHPTVRKLESALQDGEQGNTSIVVPLSEGGDQLPLYFLCGINLYRPLAQTLGPDQPAFGVYAQEEQRVLEWATTGRVSLLSIKELAKVYADAIRRHSPQGPYRLAGVSFGGVLAIETAIYLERTGQSVELVVMMDTILRQGIHRNIWKYIARQGENLRSEGLRARLGKVREKAQKHLTKTVRKLPRGLQPVGLGNVAPGVSGENIGIARVREAAYLRAMETYRGGVDRFKGRVLLIKAQDHSEWGKAIEFAHDYGWGAMLDGPLEIHEAPGNHLGLIHPPHVENVGALIRAQLG